MRTALVLVIAAAFLGSATWLIWTQLETPLSAPAPFESASADPLAGARLVASPSEIGVAEPSGIAYHPALDRLYVVGDEGHLAELDHEGRLLRVTAVKGDLEDVTVHTPTGNLLLVSEKKSRLIYFDPRTFTEIARWRLDRVALLDASPGKKQNGFEGVAFRSEVGTPGTGILSLAHQHDPAMVVHLTLEPASWQGAEIGSEAATERWRLSHHHTLTALTYASSLGRYLAIDGRRRALLIFDPNGEVAAEAPLPGNQPEGLCLDARADLWIADDQRGLWRCPGALAALAALLGPGAEQPR